MPVEPAQTTERRRSGGRRLLWAGVAAVVVLVVVVVVSLGYLLGPDNPPEFTPTEANPDPSLSIPGVVTQSFEPGQHVRPEVRIAYTSSPPYGGAHDRVWAACNGVVYPQPVRTETLVHSLEHGAVWIAYDPTKVNDADRAKLAARVDGETAMVMSPYPGLDQPISLQSWGHQLKLASADDPRIDQFVWSLRLNRFAYPEVGASCDARGPGLFDQDNPPPYQPAPPPSAVDGQTVQPERATP